MREERPRKLNRYPRIASWDRAFVRVGIPHDVAGAVVSLAHIPELLNAPALVAFLRAEAFGPRPGVHARFAALIAGHESPSRCVAGGEGWKCVSCPQFGQSQTCTPSGCRTG